jgi:hypothetical protein
MRRKLLYQLWDSEDTSLGEWDNPSEAYRDVRALYTASENPSLLHFGAYTISPKWGKKLAFRVSGHEILEYLDDVAPEEW